MRSIKPLYDVETGPNDETLFSFRELERKKQALGQYRSSIDPARSQLRNTVFDSGA